ncbi:WD40-repeat-containing domain protein [Pilobolus umbonatus]|nr:WD40-repeat-containing domain protein [Pilobolus umbonatus]
MAESSIEYTLPGVLHYLQAEWRKFEREKNEWSIEKAEYKARIALLEGERRGIENIRQTLLKRVKMLEYALRQERKRATTPTLEADGSSVVDTPHDSSTISKKAVEIDHHHVDTAIKEKSREALKSCLQEINYLTSMPTKLPLTNLLSSRSSLTDNRTRRTPPVSNNMSPVLNDTGNNSRPQRQKTINSKSPNTDRPQKNDSHLYPKKDSLYKEAMDDVEVPANVDEVAMINNMKESMNGPDMVIDQGKVLKQMKNKDQEDDLDSDRMDMDDMNENQSKLWKPRITIKGHLDSVRSACFHPEEMIVASGSDDATVKLWNLQKTTGKDGNPIKKGSLEEADPCITYRGHTDIITSVAICAHQKRVYSSSLDSTIKVWTLPSEDRSPYAAFDPSLNIATYVGHTDAIWDFKLSSKSKDDALCLLGSASADGTVKLWDTKVLNNLLKSTITFNGMSLQDIRSNRVVPTSLDFNHVNQNQLIISYSNAQIQLYDMEAEKVVMTLKGSDDSYDNTQETQINYIITHPNESMVISGHEDKFIKLFDLKSGEIIQSLSGHLDGVTSLDIDSSGTTLVSGGHDSSIRLWDMSSRTCLQEFSAHRRKGDEGVLSVKFHPSYPWMVSGGADGIVKIYHHGH